MGFLDRLFGRPKFEREMWLYVRCSKCGTPMKVRVDMYNDLSLEEGGYILRKEMMDDHCFALMRAEIRFDNKRRVRSREIEGGELISKEEYEQLLAAQ